MTIEEKFKKGKVLYKNASGDYVLELWGASTKHPDSIFHFEDFDAVDYFSKEAQIFQWLCECASKLTFPSHARDLVRWALENYATEEKVLDNIDKA